MLLNSRSRCRTRVQARPRSSPALAGPLILVASALLCSAVRAQTPPAPPPPTAPAPPAPAAAAPPASTDLSFDSFDLLEDHKPTTEQQLAAAQKAAAIEKKARLRRTMLKVHTGLGFATLGLMAATVVLGQLYYLDKYGGGPDNGQYTDAHFTLSMITTAAFATIGILGVAAPNPYPKPLRFDTALVHKIAMGLATAGMLAQVILGPLALSQEGKLDQKPIAIAHLASGYATFGFMAAGVIAYVF